jgi:hypothetical protein
VIACVGLFGFSAWPRYRRPRLSLFSMITLTMFCIGCGGSGSGGTPKGSYTVTATGKSGTQVHTASVSVSVE